MRRQLERRWITLIFADWLPHCIGSSRGSLPLVSGIYSPIASSRVPLTVCRRIDLPLLPYGFVLSYCMGVLRGLSGVITQRSRAGRCSK